ncbi:hypothetical protein P7C70_g8575, partial [Phenoliferia sp. Uapishka_3]
MAPAATNSAGKIGAISNISNNTNASWWKDSGLRRLNFLILFIYLSSAAGGYDASLIGGLYSIPRWLKDLGSPDTQRQSLLIASAFLGGLGAFIVAPWLPDVVGRRYAMAAGDVADTLNSKKIIVLIGAIAQTFVKSSNGYIGTRFVIGLGSVVSAVAAPALGIELAHPRQFGRVVSYYNVCFYAGAILAAWISFGTLNIVSSWSWRLPTLFQAAPAVLQLCALPFIPESPRWLVRNGREAEAKNILLKYHANGAEQDDLVDFEMAEIKAQQALDDKTGDNGWAMFIRTPGMRKRLYICILCGFYSQWAGNGIISYYFAPILNSVGVTSHTQTSGLYGGLAIWNACWAIWGASNVDRFGRRTLWLASGVAMLISYILVTALSATYARTKDVKARTKGLGIVFLTCYVALVFNTYANPLALAAISVSSSDPSILLLSLTFAHIQWHYYFVYIGVISVMLVVIYFYFPETRGRSLEQIAEIFDGVSDDSSTRSPEVEGKEDVEYKE